jgi:hypothetical protein
MDRQLERKIDRLVAHLEESELARYSQSCTNHKHLVRELVINSLLASVVGYFVFRILDHHLRILPTEQPKKTP